MQQKKANTRETKSDDFRSKSSDLVIFLVKKNTQKGVIPTFC